MDIWNLAPLLAIRTATSADVSLLTELFDAYRVFYGAASDRAGSAAFTSERLRSGVTRFFVAELEDDLLGFAHLIPTFDSVALSATWIVQDVFVEPCHRKRGVGTALLQRVESFARSCDATKLQLRTARTNTVAQGVYVSNGYDLDDRFLTYVRTLS